MGTLWQDLRYAARMLTRSPAFTLAAVASLAIGIGANTAVFSVANAVLLRPLAVADAGRLVELHRRTSEGDGQAFAVSYPDYQFYRDHNDEVFSGLLCWGEATLALSSDGPAEQVFGMVVSGNYFDTLALRPAAGRFFTTDEDTAPGAHPVAVLAHGFWQSRFGGDPAIVGRSVTLSGRPFTVVGVAPPDFKSTVPLYAPDVWVPVSMQREVLPGGDMLGSRDAEWLHMVGRLREGVSTEQAEAQASALALRIRAEHPEDGVGAEGEPLKATLLGVRLAPVGFFPVEVRQMIAGALGLVLAVVTLVLLIACANLSSLLLARAVVRRREIAVRLALGASRARIVRQLLTESVLLCVISGAAGVMLALWMTDLLVAFRPDARLPIDFDFSLDWRVLSLTLALSLLTGVLFGLLPALQSARLDVSSTLKDDAGGGRGPSRARDWFVVSQVALSLVLLVSAGLLLRALKRAHNVFPGERPEEILTLTPDPQLLGYDEGRTREFYRQLVERVEALPGVESAGLADGVPVAGGYAMTAFEFKGEQRMAGVNAVSPGYFETLGIPLVRGRDFSPADRAGAPPVAVVDEALARRFFEGEDPVGQLITFDAGPAQGRRRIEVVGVVRGGADASLGWRPHFFVYLPAEQPLFGEGTMRRMILHARAPRLPREQTLAALRRETAALDPNVPVLDAGPLAERIDVALLPQRVAASVAGVFGLVGLALASVGIYGIVSYTVAQRTREIGVRMALGAQRGDVLALILRRGLRLSLYGIALGLAGAFVATRLLEEMLYGLSATDPVTFASVSLLLAAVALLASYVPARRATKVDPMVALRYE